MSVIQQLNKEDFRRKMYTDVLRGRRRRSNDERPIKRLWLAVRLIKFAVDHNVDTHGREKGTCLPSVDSDLGGIIEHMSRFRQLQQSVLDNGRVSDLEHVGTPFEFFDPRQVSTIVESDPGIIALLDSSVRERRVVVVHVLQCIPVRVEKIKVSILE